MQYDKHKLAREKFNDIDSNPRKYLIIHYSCDSFYDTVEGKSPRITSIAVYDYGSGQTASFSLHRIAEQEDVNMVAENFDRLEKKMLEGFFAYAKEHSSCLWIHWNMRDSNFGFNAIEHRYSVLRGKPYKIPDQQKIDLSRELINYYGANYIDHPRMEKLLQYNDIRVKDYLSGPQEAEAFRKGEYVRVHMSTLRKVTVFAEILDRAINNTLKVKSKWHEAHGLTFQGIFNWCRERWWIQLIWSVLMLFAGTLIEKMI